ncbi:DUF7847 domain-containing protein [Aquicella lusitana]|uniref:Glycerophosphoryl diester phosphodiesterase membrane domain-containing protein n=1 Tax=Aquicella lusitana TaxID=254246 RepID=A0A370GS61_9COXI|nr:hypothetical protein [Aquicella lusitana]RDI46545.1 hypothetical protein C8D86_10569 [Aquicella lusitana]VVC74209.1 hypothetical protein AQULUS_19740 [Aquicella lusitana]
MDTMLPSQPESYRPLINRSFRLYRASFSKVIWPALILSIVIFIPRLISVIVGQDILATLPAFSPYRLWQILINLVALMLFIAIMWHMYCEARGLHEPLVEDIGKGIRKAVSVFIATIIQSAILFGIAAIMLGIQILLHQYNLLFANNWVGIIATSIAFIGQFVLLLYVSVLFIFLVPLIAIEDKGILVALERSVLLAWNHWWRVFSVQLTPWISYIILLFLIRFGLGINIHIFFLQDVPHTIWTSLLHLLIFALFIPWVAALLLVQIKDLELRHELARHEQKA